MISENEFRALLQSASTHVEDRELAGLADQALRRARRHTLRAGLVTTVATAALLAAGGGIVANWPTVGPPVIPANLSPTTMELAQGFSLYPVLSQRPGLCASDAGLSYVHQPTNNSQATCYRVDPAKGLSVTNVRSLKPVQHPGFWAVQVQLIAQDTPALADLTRTVTGRTLAVIAGDRVVAAPNINGTVTSGQFEIPAGSTQQEADNLVRQLTGR